MNHLERRARSTLTRECSGAKYQVGLGPVAHTKNKFVEEDFPYAFFLIGISWTEKQKWSQTNYGLAAIVNILCLENAFMLTTIKCV